MENGGLTFGELADSGDNRGSSFALSMSWLTHEFPVRDGHITTLLPGHIRGNHYHRIRQEILIVMFEDRWSLHWDTGEGTPLHSRLFGGQGTVAIRVEPHASHAIRNDGSVLLHMVGLSDTEYDPRVPDTFPRKVCDAETSRPATD